MKFLNAMIEFVGHIDKSHIIDRHSIGIFKLSVSAALASPFGHKRPIRVEFLDAIVELVGHINMARIIRGDTIGRSQLSVPGSFAAPLGHE